MSTPMLELRAITKNFPGVKALDGVSLTLYPGEVHVIAGENGAGKSTIMKVLSGVYRPDEGETLIDGAPIHISNPEMAAKLGIRMIYQELNLIPELSVASNIFLGQESYKNRLLGILDYKKMLNDAKKILDNMHVNIDPAVKVKDLGVGQQQVVEIAKALSMEVKIIVFDEPTSSLMDKEIKELFALIRRLKSENIGMFYISHRLEELFEIGDRVSVLRDGKLIDTKPIDQIEMSDLIWKIANRDVRNLYPHKTSNPGEVLLEINGLTNENFKDIDLIVRSGEIVGLAGLVGAGRTELARAIFGIDDYEAGLVNFCGKAVPKHDTQKSVALGISLLPEDRKNEGLALDLPVKDNITIASLKNLFPKFFMDSKKEIKAAEKYVKDLNIATSSVKKLAKKLSGGTQQKVVVSKWLMTNAKFFIFDEPTRGVDVGAKTSIYEIMDELVEGGAGILMISSDLLEILGMTDRIYIMAGGRVVAEKATKETNQTEILTYAFNRTLKEKIS